MKGIFLKREGETVSGGAHGGGSKGGDGRKGTEVCVSGSKSRERGGAAGAAA